MKNTTSRVVSIWSIAAALILFVAWQSPAPVILGPALPDGLAQDPRMTWRPTLNVTAAVTVDAAGVVIDYHGAIPKLIPTNGREPITVAAEQLKNNAGEWIGIYGRQGPLNLGDKIDQNDTARPSGFQGISVVGLDTDPSSSDFAVIAGFGISQRIGEQRDFAVLNLTIDSWTDRPCQIGEDAIVGAASNLYVENVDCLTIPNGLRGKTPKGSACTTWVFKVHGKCRHHFKRVRMVGGVTAGDGNAGASQHMVYSDAECGQSEFVECEAHGCSISAIYVTTRYGNRVQLPSGAWLERYSFGTLLIDDLTAIDCGVLGSYAVNVCGGVQDVIVRDMHWRVNLDDLFGNAPTAKWAGGAIQIYVDHKQFELDYTQPVTSNSVPIALGYSMEQPGGSLPESVDADKMGLPKDGFGGARSLTIEGGTFEGAAVYPPIFSLRDVKQVTIAELTTTQRDTDRAFTVRGVGKTAWFAPNGISAQCGPAQAAGKPPGKLPASLGGNWNQQARFLSRKPTSAWFGSAKIYGATVAPGELDTWK